MAVELKKIDTEKRNERSMHIDSMSTLDMVKLINEEDIRLPRPWRRSHRRSLRRWT